MRHRPSRPILAGLLLTTALAPLAAQAQTPPAWQPSVLLSFTGSSGAQAGNGPFTPPIWHAEEKRVYGTTREGGDPYRYSINAYVELDTVSGRAYGLAADGSAYQSWTLGPTLGTTFSSLVQASSGQIVAGTSRAVLNPAASPAETGTFRHFTIRNNAITALDVPSQALRDQGLSPRGTMAADEAGNVYFGAESGQICSTGTSLDRSLYRLTAAGAVEAVVNFCDFAENRRTQAAGAWSFRKGGVPQNLLYSKADKALYIVSITGTGSGTSQYYPEWVTGSKTVTGFLVRIDATALAKPSLAESDIDLLHVFTSDTGVPSAASDLLSTSLVEDGDWLYGTGPSILWRLRKSDRSIHVVHTFPLASTATTQTSAAGVAPAGSLVRALDGNIYGTTTADATALNAAGNRPAGAGSLYRVVVGAAADRSDDRVEFLHFFDAATEGNNPVGLSAGPAAQGTQWLFGASRYGGSGSAGTVFRVNVPVPEVVVTSFKAASSSLTAGQAPTLSWTSEQASACVAGGGWSGDKNTLGEETLPAIAQAGTYTYTLQCSGPTGESTISEVVIEVAPAPAPADNGGGGGGLIGLLALLALAAPGIARGTRRMNRAV